MRHSLDLANALRRDSVSDSPVDVGTVDVYREDGTTTVVYVAPDGAESIVFQGLDGRRGTIAAGLAQAIFLSDPVPATAIDCVARWVDQGRATVRTGVDLFAACWSAGFELWGKPCGR